MESTMFPSAPESTALAQLHDQAKREAQRLRREAIDDFWRSAGRLHARLARSKHPSTTTTTKV